MKYLGYKSQLQRDPEVPDILMEVYVPILKSKGDQKLKQQNAKWRSVKGCEQ